MSEETFTEASNIKRQIKAIDDIIEVIRENKYLDSKNKPYQNYIDRGYFTVKLGAYVNQGTGDTVEYTQVRVTGKGQLYFTNRLLDEYMSQAS